MTFMYQRILVPIDGSVTSSRALQEAIKLADGKAELRLIYVLDEGFSLDAESQAYIDYAALLDALRQTGERALVKAALEVRKSGMTADTKLLEVAGADVSSVINGEAKGWSADLIVMGTHGRSGFNRLLMGSVAERVIREASVPVLLLHAE
jgi:nucleotide-binding universal stress UspA family protein